ncbi:Proactivator polypeptide-like 1 [Rhynchospora pubera]|uniref:Pulmonary surfactant-associated protein B n=1 Tax=Rhynchospora pubera TaxID=906938 RepID=A0AAV8FGB5_9POAL|nr:Proactivator polypeptide-like 1 [Rhynchospora pubera]KAJ4782383.1 Proactivator polypeptide-like 1 [Rhynchospora pubera]KAJ4789302.1 Proactivator polypeptide-like 1 [Rhynchospora pubera]KAJ4808816.1 Proactivator polypeptide-like 1 [Rhynchospora pubera]
MGLQVKFLLLVALVISYCANIEARNMMGVMDADDLGYTVSKQWHARGELCDMCELYSTQALSYLNQNETQTEILSILHQTCSKLSPLKQQCITLVDYYVPLFFIEVATISPDEFCEKMHLCKETKAIKLPTSGPPCELCQEAVLKILTKLQDPSTQVDIIAMLIKACTEFKVSFPKCNTMVSQYAPEVINSAETFLKDTNICASVCKADAAATKFIFSS